MKRALMLATVALLMAGMMVAMAMPALAAKPAPTKEECVGTLVAIQHGDKLTGQQQQLPKQFATVTMQHALSRHVWCAEAPAGGPLSARGCP